MENGTLQSKNKFEGLSDIILGHFRRLLCGRFIAVEGHNFSALMHTGAGGDA
jgi:hypothetical protein